MASNLSAINKKGTSPCIVLATDQLIILTLARSVLTSNITFEDCNKVQMSFKSSNVKIIKACTYVVTKFYNCQKSEVAIPCTLILNTAGIGHSSW